MLIPSEIASMSEVEKYKAIRERLVKTENAAPDVRKMLGTEIDSIFESLNLPLTEIKTVENRVFTER